MRAGRPELRRGPLWLYCKDESHPAAVAICDANRMGLGNEWTEEPLDQLCVEGDLGVVGEELRDRAAGLSIGRSLVKDFLRCAGNAGGGGEGDLRNSEMHHRPWPG